jgi:hypothetical protein
MECGAGWSKDVRNVLRPARVSVGRANKLRLSRIVPVTIWLDVRRPDREVVCCWMGNRMFVLDFGEVVG